MRQGLTGSTRTLNHAGTLVLLIVVSCCFSQCSILPNAAPAIEISPELEIHVIDVGYGESILVRAPDGSTVLWDSGYPEQAGPVLDYLASVHVTSLSLAVNSHPHPDHIGGFPEILGKLKVLRIVGAFPLDHPEVPHAFREAITNQELSYQIMRQGDKLTIGQDLTMEFLNPDRLVPDLNDSSLVARVVFGRTRILLTADIGPAAQQRLLSVNMDSTTLHACSMTLPHHGGASWLPFFDAVDPTIVTLSVGPNPWGNPKERTLEYLQDKGLTINRTDEEGTIVVKCTPDAICRVDSPETPAHRCSQGE